MTHGIGNVFDAHAAGIAVHSVSRVGPATLHMWRVPGKDHCRLIDKVDGQVLRRRRWFCKKYIPQHFRRMPSSKFSPSSALTFFNFTQYISTHRKHHTEVTTQNINCRILYFYGDAQRFLILRTFFDTPRSCDYLDDYPI